MAINVNKRHDANPPKAAVPDSCPFCGAQLKAEVLGGLCPKCVLHTESLMGDPAAPRYADLGAELGMSENAVKTAVSRLRRRYCELLREEIAHTVSSPAEVEEEIRHLFVVVGS